MDTTTINQTAAVNVSKAATNSKTALWEKIEYNRFGLSVGVLAIVGCMGGLAAAFGSGLGLVFMLSVAWASGVALAMTLAVAPMRIMLGAAAIALTVDLVAILVSLIG